MSDEKRGGYGIHKNRLNIASTPKIMKLELLDLCEVKKSIDLWESHKKIFTQLLELMYE